jgi:hypothetical protein
VKVTNQAIWQALIPLRTLLAQKFPVRTSYNLAKMAQGSQGQYDVLNETRNQLITKYGELDEKGKPTIKEGTPALESFLKEWVELMALEVEVAVDEVKLPVLVASTCDKCHHNMDKPFEIEPSVLMLLDKFIGI